MTPATYDFTVVRGSAGEGQGLKFRLKAKQQDGTLINLPYDDVRLSIYNRSAFLLRVSLQDGTIIETDEYNAELEWQPTAAESRLIPIGAKAKYELEVRYGDNEIVYMMGTITGVGGLNDDIGEGS